MPSNFHPDRASDGSENSQYDYDQSPPATHHSRMDCASDDGPPVFGTPIQAHGHNQHGLDLTTYLALRQLPNSNSSAIPMLRNSALFVEWIGSEFALNPYQRNLLRNLHEVVLFSQCRSYLFIYPNRYSYRWNQHNVLHLSHLWLGILVSIMRLLPIKINGTKCPHCLTKSRSSFRRKRMLRRIRRKVCST
jgi:hypothetical protein